VKLALKPTIHFKAIEDGVFFLGSHGSFVLQCKGLATVVQRLLRLLDGRRDVAALRAALPAEVIPLFDRVVDGLQQHRMLLVVDGPGCDVDAGMRERYPQAIAYLEDTVSDYGDAFRRWRTTAIVVGGHGVALRAAVRALAVSGLQRLLVLGEHRADPAAAQALELLELQARVDPEFRFTLQPEDAFPDAGIRLWTADDLEQRKPPDRTWWACGGIGGHVWVGPRSAAGFVAMADLQVRLASFEAHRVDPPGAALELAGSILALAAFQAVCGVSGADLTHHALMIGPTLETSRHPVFPVAYITGPYAVSAYDAGARSSPDDASSHVALLRRFRPLTDRALGILADDASNDLPQIPLTLDTLTVRLPDGRCTAVRAWGLDPEDARRRLLRRAFSLYAAETRIDRDSRPLTAHWDAAQGRRDALAIAHARRGEGRWEILDVSSSDASVRTEDIHTLRQALSLLAASPVTIQVRADVERTFCEAGVWIEGCCAARAVGATVEDAVKEALGQACMQLQLGLPLEDCEADQQPDGELGDAHVVDRAQCDPLLVSFGIHAWCVGRGDIAAEDAPPAREVETGDGADDR
jgi:hypothetical protein